MQLEKLKKTELVKLARELRQKIKLLEKQVSNVKNVELDDSKLPLLAQTFYRQGDNYVVDVFRYSPKSGNVKPFKKIVESTKHLGLHKLDINVAELIQDQKFEEDGNE